MSTESAYPKFDCPYCREAGEKTTYERNQAFEYARHLEFHATGEIIARKGKQSMKNYVEVQAEQRNLVKNWIIQEASTAQAAQRPQEAKQKFLVAGYMEWWRAQESAKEDRVGDLRVTLLSALSCLVLGEQWLLAEEVARTIRSRYCMKMLGEVQDAYMDEVHALQAEIDERRPKKP